jgi:DNA replication protein DnaC
MESKKQEINALCAQFNLSGTALALDGVISRAEKETMGFMQFTMELLRAEAAHRLTKDETRRLKAAGLPKNADLDYYDTSIPDGLTAARLKQLRELNWIDQIFNLVLQGPSGVGKTMLASGLCRDAVKAGYKAYFRTMEEIVNTLKMKDMVRSQQVEYKRLQKAHLIVLDDMMLFPLEKSLAVTFFHFINQIFESTSIIITTNKKPADWASLLDDEVIATALLDRLLFRCEIINLSGKSYRMQNRKSFFES